jgi:hypothetical protein
MKAQCTLCGMKVEPPQVAERFDESEIGRHFIDHHPHVVEMVASMAELFETQGVGGED